MLTSGFYVLSLGLDSHTIEMKILKATIFLICISVIFQACSAVHKNRPSEELAERNPTIVSKIGKLSLKTSIATQVNIPEERNYSFGDFLRGYNPYAGPIAYTVFALPLVSYLSLSESKKWVAISEALTSAEFTPAIDQAVKARLHAVFAEENLPEVAMGIIIQKVEIVGTQNCCLEVSADLNIHRSAKEVMYDQINITYNNTSENTPLPRCDHVDSFAADNGSLVKVTMAEYAEILADMAVSRLHQETAK